MADLKFVTTEGHERPTPSNSRPISAGDEEGRGSFVYFNQATMYQSSETGYRTLNEAKAAGHHGTTDFARDAQQAFTDHATFVPA